MFPLRFCGDILTIMEIQCEKRKGVGALQNMINVFYVQTFL